MYKMRDLYREDHYHLRYRTFIYFFVRVKFWFVRFNRNEIIDIAVSNVWSTRNTSTCHRPVTRVLFKITSGSFCFRLSRTGLRAILPSRLCSSGCCYARRPLDSHWTRKRKFRPPTPRLPPIRAATRANATARRSTCANRTWPRKTATISSISGVL